MQEGPRVEKCPIQFLATYDIVMDVSIFFYLEQVNFHVTLVI